MMTSKRQRSAGSVLAIFAAISLILIAFMAIAIYTGVQAFAQNEIQKTASSTALSSASAYYRVDANGNPVPQGPVARDIAQETFNAVKQSGSIKGFTPQMSFTDSNGRVTVEVSGSLGTQLLAPSGINNLNMSSQATAQPLKYVPTDHLGAISILPIKNDIGSYSRIINLAFPLSNLPNSYDIVVEQPVNDQQGYVLEACSDDWCYDLGAAAQPIGTSRVINQGGANVIYGSAAIDMEAAGIYHATKLRITHGNNFTNYFVNGVNTPFPAGTPKPLIIQKISLYGYAGLCPAPANCPVPAGFKRATAP